MCLCFVDKKKEVCVCLRHTLLLLSVHLLSPWQPQSLSPTPHCLYQRVNPRNIWLVHISSQTNRSISWWFILKRHEISFRKFGSQIRQICPLLDDHCRFGIRQRERLNIISCEHVIVCVCARVSLYFILAMNGSNSFQQIQ